MDWMLIVMMLGALGTAFFTFIEYQQQKTTKKHLTKILILDLAIIAGGVFMLVNSWMS